MVTTLARDVAAAVIAMIIVLGLVLVVIFDVVNGKPVYLPPELSIPASLIVGYFYGSHAATNGALAGSKAIREAAQQIQATSATNNKPPA